MIDPHLVAQVVGTTNHAKVSLMATGFFLLHQTFTCWKPCGRKLPPFLWDCLCSKVYLLSLFDKTKTVPASLQTHPLPPGAHSLSEAVESQDDLSSPWDHRACRAASVGKAGMVKCQFSNPACDDPHPARITAKAKADQLLFEFRSLHDYW